MYQYSIITSYKTHNRLATQITQKYSLSKRLMNGPFDLKKSFRLCR